MSETSSQAKAWHPGGNPNLTAVPLSAPEDLSRKRYLELLENRLSVLLVSLGPQAANDLLEEWRSPELLPLRRLSLQAWPEFLLRECASVHHAVWREAGLQGWPRKAAPSKEASAALESVGLREWLSLALPNLPADSSE